VVPFLMHGTLKSSILFKSHLMSIFITAKVDSFKTFHK
jgi:hypothetical protein